MMERLNGSFIITGEVVGQRPMSQRAGGLNQVISLADDSEDRLILRPLSCKGFFKILQVPRKLKGGGVWIRRIRTNFGIILQGPEGQEEEAGLEDLARDCFGVGRRITWKFNPGRGGNWPFKVSTTRRKGQGFPKGEKGLEEGEFLIFKRVHRDLDFWGVFRIGYIWRALLENGFGGRTTLFQDFTHGFGRQKRLVGSGLEEFRRKALIGGSLPTAGPVTVGGAPEYFPPS